MSDNKITLEKLERFSFALFGVAISIFSIGVITVVFMATLGFLIQCFR